MTTIQMRTWFLRISLAWALICAVDVLIHADTKHVNPHRYDGNDWVTWSADRKLGYVHGLRAGVYLSSYMLWEANLSANKVINPLLEQDVDQQISVIDQAYKDPKRKIVIRKEFSPVRQIPIGVIWRLSVEGKL